MGADRAVLRLAGRQHGMVSLAQLLAAGLTRDGVRHRVARGWLTRLHRGVYLVGPLRTPHSEAMAAVLACGAGALLSHASAAAIWGFTPPRAGAIDVSVTRRNPGSRPGIRLHLYGKRQPKPGRKMGHLTALADTPDDAAALVREARAALSSSHVRA